MWIKLKSIQHIRDHGKLVTYHPGDWVDVGKQAATQMVADGAAEIPKIVTMQFDFNMSNCGIVTREAGEVAMFPSLPITVGEPALAYDYTLIIASIGTIRQELIPVGFERLRHGWSVAAPFVDYRTLARDIGSDEDRALTESVIHDLRVPVYDTRLVYVSGNDEGNALMAAWAEEKTRGNDERLAFLRALYRTTATMCALPVSWKAIK